VARALLAALGLLCSCTLMTTMGGPARGHVPFARRPVPGTELYDWKGVIHCHSYLSHDSDGTIEQIAAAAESVGIDFVVMTDHQTEASVAEGARGMIGRTLFVTGAELRAGGASLLAFPLVRYVEPRLALDAMLAEVRAQGGLAMIGHAERFAAWDHDGFDGVEIYNLHAAAKAVPVHRMIAVFLLGPVRTLFEQLSTRPDAVLSRYDELTARGPLLAAVGGNDAHANVRVFGPLGGTVGTYEEVFHTLSTHVLAKELSEPALVEALRAARSYVVYDLYRDGTGFDFRAVAGDSEALLGATVAATPGLELRVTTPWPAEIRLLRNGVLDKKGTGTSLVRPAPGLGDWRVEAYLDGVKPWIFSSPIRVR
jgi:hypothetical protein